MNKNILTPEKVQKLQNEIYQKMSATKKLKIVGQLFSLGKKLDGLKNQKSNDTRKTSL